MASNVENAKKGGKRLTKNDILRLKANCIKENRRYNIKDTFFDFKNLSCQQQRHLPV